MLITAGRRYIFLFCFSLLFITSTTYYLRPETFSHISQIIPYRTSDQASGPNAPPPAPIEKPESDAESTELPEGTEPSAESTELIAETESSEQPPEPIEKKPKYKPQSVITARPIVENFPLAFEAHSAADLPPIPSWIRPPVPHVKENTPLFIGFTRNWRLLQQTVVSYITAGWPPEDIYVVENTGVMYSNRDKLLTLQNPFFLNHTRLHMFGVNVMLTPTLFTFAQLQNFYLWTALERNWTHYFWSHSMYCAC